MRLIKGSVPVLCVFHFPYLAVTDGIDEGMYIQQLLLFFPVV